MIQARGLTKRFGAKTAVDHAEFTVEPGRVTGFLGPNGAGKTTTMRMVLGLTRPTEGDVAVNGRHYGDIAAPLREVGALLDAQAVHGGRSAYNHVLCLARSNGIPRSRVDEVLRLVGLESVARKPAKGFSLGMSQRLGIATALLGDPGVLMFDEPVNGLDPEGIVWIRSLMRQLAGEGRTVFVSSHLMSEMAVTADHLIVIGQGRILADTGMQEFIAANASSHVLVRSPDLGRLVPSLTRRGWRVETGDDESAKVYDVDATQIGDLAHEAGLRLHELTNVRPSLEEAFMRITFESVEYHAGSGATGPPDGQSAAAPADGPAGPAVTPAPSTIGPAAGPAPAPGEEPR